METNWTLPGEPVTADQLVIGQLTSLPLSLLLEHTHATGQLIVVVDRTSYGVGQASADACTLLGRQLRGSEIMRNSQAGQGFNPFWFAGPAGPMSCRNPTDAELSRLATLIQRLLGFCAAESLHPFLVQKLRGYYVSSYAAVGPDFSGFHAYLTGGRNPAPEDGWVPLFLARTQCYTAYGRLAYLLNAEPRQLLFLHEVQNNYLVIGIGNRKADSERRADEWAHLLVLLHTVDGVLGGKDQPLRVVLPHVSIAPWVPELGLLSAYLREGPAVNRAVIASWGGTVFESREPGPVARALLQAFDTQYLCAQPFGQRVYPEWPRSEQPLVELSGPAQELFFQLRPADENGRTLLAHCSSTGQMSVLRYAPSPWQLEQRLLEGRGNRAAVQW